MKLKSLLLPAMFYCALGIGSACANPLTVYMSAHVTAVDDSGGALSGIFGAPIVTSEQLSAMSPIVREVIERQSPRMAS